jgi:pantoate--beta-alanine ligase
MQQYADELRAQGKKIAFVPTMGYFHEGHLSLMKIGRKLGDELVVSIFVNPTQFGQNEDLGAYPRDMERDLAMAESVGTDTVFAPEADQIYLDGFETYVRVEKSSEPLCGISRPVHFRGVATVCTKLFNIVKPHFAVFGEKDYQQYLVVSRMVRDLNMDVKIVPGPTYREEDGLAMSSRNVYLKPKERKQATVIYRSLKEAEKMVAEGERDAGTILAKVREMFDDAPLAEVDYIELRTLPDLEEIDRQIVGPSLLAIAANFGSARLIDNTVLLKA